MALHKDLTGADLHEPKGVATADSGQVYVADGAGSGSWTDLVNTPPSLSSTIENKSSSSINPSTLDVPIDATFDTSVSNTNISIANTGVITFLTPGVYITTINMNFGRSSGAGTAVVAARLLIDGSPSGYVQGMSLSDSTSARPVQFTIFRNFAASTTMKVQVLRDSSGINNGGLIATPTAAGGWDDIPAYWVRIHKLDGVN